MNKGLSNYLDLVRSGAALAVFIHHLLLNYGCYDPGADCRAAAFYPQHVGHSAVVLFFVLSGYVITYVASERERQFRAYALSRIARIYSVAAPVLILVGLVDLSFMAVGRTATVPMYEYARLWEYIPLALSFTTDHWFLGVNALSHGGWWSLAYEVWYYVLFAAAFYPSGWRRWALTALVAVAMGPKLLALFPCWLMGSLIYRMHRGGAEMSVGPARTVMAVTGLAILAIMLSDALHGVDRWADGLTGGFLSTEMRFSQWVVGDTILAALFAANVYAAKFASLAFGALTKPIKFVASFTFVFYMAHGEFIRIGIDHFGLNIWGSALLAIAGCYLLGLVTERQKDRLQTWLEDIAERLFDRPRRAVDFTG